MSKKYSNINTNIYNTFVLTVRMGWEENLKNLLTVKNQKLVFVNMRKTYPKIITQNQVKLQCLKLLKHGRNLEHMFYFVTIWNQVKDL